jgi:hypothetical protein
MPLQGVVLATSVTVSDDLVILLSSLVPNVSSPGSDMDPWLLYLLKRVPDPETAAAPVLLPMCLVTVVSLTEETAGTLLLGARLARVVLVLVLNALSDLSELLLLLRRTCSGARECAPMRRRLPPPTVAHPHLPLFLTPHLLRVVALA